MPVDTGERWLLDPAVHLLRTESYDEFGAQLLLARNRPQGGISEVRGRRFPPILILLQLAFGRVADDFGGVRPKGF